MILKNKVIWITGASSGIGEAIAKELVQDQPKLILSARNVAELERVKSECEDPSIKILPLDVTDFEHHQAIVDDVIKEYGHIDMLINNAGISQRDNVLDTKLKVDQKIMDINYFGSISLTKTTIPHMIARKSGHQVVISSVAGKIGIKGRASYCASKFAIQGFYESLRAELYEHNIDITLVCPGYVLTNISKNALMGDGSLHNKVDANIGNGLSVDYLAKKAVAAIKAKKPEVIIAKTEGKAVLLNRFFPSLLRRIVRNRS